jgi:hypothetical protein
MSSSRRGPGSSDAIVSIRDRTVGPVRLPDHRPEDFVAHFNRVYRSLGMVLRTVTSECQNEKTPVSSEADGDLVV